MEPESRKVDLVEFWKKQVYESLMGQIPDYRIETIVAVILASECFASELRSRLLVSLGKEEDFPIESLLNKQ